MRPEDYKAAKAVFKNAFPVRGTKKQVNGRNNKKSPQSGSQANSPKPQTAALDNDPFYKEHSLYQGSFSFAEKLDAFHGPGREFGIISGPLSIEVVNNESVFSEAIDQLRQIDDCTGNVNIESACNSRINN